MRSNRPAGDLQNLFGSSDFLTAFLGRIWKRLFFTISQGKIPNSVVIKLFVKIVNESFFKWNIKSQTFSSLWPGYCLFWFCKRNTTHKISGTSAVYWVVWFDESGVYRTAIKLQKNESGKCRIWNKFYIKDVYWNKFNMKIIVNMSYDLRCLIFC